VLVRAGMVGLGGLEPPASSLSALCTRPRIRRIAPATCTKMHRWRPLRTARFRWSVDQTWTKPPSAGSTSLTRTLGLGRDEMIAPDAGAGGATLRMRGLTSCTSIRPSTRTRTTKFSLLRKKALGQQLKLSIRGYMAMGPGCRLRHQQVVKAGGAGWSNFKKHCGLIASC
jgi:hypothetical protein